MNKEEKLISEIKKIYEKYIFKDATDFSVNDYNALEAEIWALGKKYDYDNPFKLLPNSFSEAGLAMMNASSDGQIEPDLDAKIKYLEKMRESYEEINKPGQIKSRIN